MAVRVFLLPVLVAQASAARLGATIPMSSTCSYINSEYSACNVQAMCSLCIIAASCEFNVDSLACEAKSAVAMANGTATTYCSSNDTVCATCTATSADPICRGEDGSCTCDSLCSAVEPVDSSACSDNEGAILLYAGVALGLIFVSFFVFVLIKCRRRYLQTLRQRALASQRRRESELLRMRQPQLALNLVGWRDTVDVDKLEVHKLDACCYVLKERGPVAAIVVDEEEPSSSMETTSTFSEVQSPRLSEPASALASSPAASSSRDECDYRTMDDRAAANGDCNAAVRDVCR